MLVLVVYRNRIPYPPGHPAPLPLYTPPPPCPWEYNIIFMGILPRVGGARRLHAGGRWGDVSRNMVVEGEPVAVSPPSGSPPFTSGASPSDHRVLGYGIQ